MVMNGWVTPLSFHVNLPSHSLDKEISNSDLETWRSMSLVWSKGRIIRSAHYLINSLPFHFISIRPIVPEIQLFRHLTLKNQCYEWGQRSRSHSIPSIHPMLAGHMRPATSGVRPASAQCCWLCHLSSDGLVESDCTQSGTVHRKYTGLPRRIDRNEYYFTLLYIVRQVTVPYSALQFRRNSPVFWCFEILCQNIRYRVAHVCGSWCTRGCKHRAPLWFTENMHLPMWILSIAISIIDLNVHRWSTTKLM